ncbi:MAG TPA: CocE/NonD family hydrolase, partial [Steroidobacteraceae bacterium]|nr:CocE/NonD family hydrolase [Steroidobacteraceae bacterium]
DTFAMLTAFLLIAVSPSWGAQVFDFRVPASPSDAAAAISDLASRLIPVYQDSDPERYLTNLSALQMAVGDYAAADISRQSLRDRRRKSDFGPPVSRALVFDIYAHAKALEIENKVTFADAFTSSYRDSMRPLDDRDEFAVARWLGTSPSVYRDALQRAFDQFRSRDRIDESDAIELIWKYVAFDAYRTFGALVVLLNAEDDHRRYATDSGIVIERPGGVHISVTVIRPTGLNKPLPALLEFAQSETQGDAMDSAARGYVGVVAHVSAKRKSAAGIDPFAFAGADAREVIDWIAKQTWSDGRVGMYGEAYSGYAPWAAAKRLPKALKAIATSVSVAPGVSFPMEGNIFQNAAYGWSLQMSDAARVDGPDSADAPEWRALNEKWYQSGRRYRDLGRLYGKHNPVFIRWLNHPSYDAYWQNLLPYREQFAHIDIPVLTMTGYYAASAPGDLYFFTQHHRYNPHANHTLLIGPYDESMMRAGAAANLRGYQVDPVALVDFRELRYQWFDHVFKDAAMPALLSDAVNYEVMGANEWRHAASLEAMADGSLRYYLDTAGSGANRRLSLHKQANDAFVPQNANLVDRRDAAWTPPTDLVSKSLAPRFGTIFVSEPLPKASAFSGLFSGRLDFEVNKMDLDLNITLYELLANGDYVRLFSPTYEMRASYAEDRAHRHLLKAGERQKLAFKSERITSRQLQAGSRIAMVLSISKRPDREINYGTGGDVSEESIADGKIPIKIRWYSDSYIDIPIHK